MTTHLGTFIPLQAQGLGLGNNGLNQTIGLGNNALNQTFGIGINGLNQNLLLGQTSGQNNTGTPVYLVPTYSTNHNGIVQGVLPNGSTIAFIPNTNHISGGSYLPTNASIQNTATVGFQTGNQLGGIAIGNSTHSHSFATELFENNNEYVLSFDVPGIDIEDLDISLAGNTVYINGIRKDSREASTLAYSEIAKGNITRAITVPFDVSANKTINTSLENGVLKIRIAKENQYDQRSSARKVKIG